MITYTEYAEPTSMAEAFDNVIAWLWHHDGDPSAQPKGESLMAAVRVALSEGRSAASAEGVELNGYLLAKLSEMHDHAKKVASGRSSHSMTQEVIWSKRGATNFRDQLADIVNERRKAAARFVEWCALFRAHVSTIRGQARAFAHPLLLDAFERACHSSCIDVDVMQLAGWLLTADASGVSEAEAVVNTLCCATGMELSRPDWTPPDSAKRRLQVSSVPGSALY